MNKKIKFVIILIILLCIYTYICAYSYASEISENLSKNIFRLHIIANSNSEEDQNLKYKVRDNLLQYMNKICKNCSSKDEVIKIVYLNQDNFKAIAEETIKKEGFTYPVKIEIGNFEFPTKSYGDISFPAGYYDALKVNIGDSLGHNWWCVMFPPLCFVNTNTGLLPTESKETLQKNLSEEEYSIISDSENNNISFKFKILEFFKK